MPLRLIGGSPAEAALPQGGQQTLLLGVRVGAAVLGQGPIEAVVSRLIERSAPAMGGQRSRGKGRGVR